VLLISDPTTDKSAAALDVRVGHLSDPAELPGLAHFLEHMLFMGTKKYPDENEYNVFLAQHGGSSNAYTDTEDTKCEASHKRSEPRAKRPPARLHTRSVALAQALAHKRPQLTLPSCLLRSQLLL
jgi:hypothetical protein